MNAREGIKTIEHGLCFFIIRIKLKTMNAREGIKTWHNPLHA